MIEMMQLELARSATTMSMTTSRGSIFSAAAMAAIVFPSYFFIEGARTSATITPSAPPAPSHWFSHSVEGPAMSAFTFARWAGSESRLRRGSRPPSRTHGGRQASRPLEARFQGYWLAATSIPASRAASIFFRISGIRPKLGA